MKLAFISDLHIGDKSKTDMFGHDETSFIKFLEYLELNFDKIILLGDIFECLCPLIPFDSRRQLQKAIDTYPNISSKFLTNKKYIYIPGNHDYIALEMLGLDDHTIILNKTKSKVLIKHGHQFDNIVSSAPRLCEFAAWIAGWMLRFNLKPIYDCIINIERQLHDDKINITSYHKKAIISAKKTKAKFVITGHTHVLRTLIYNGITYVNCGSCSRGRINYASIDTDTEIIQLFDSYQ